MSVEMLKMKIAAFASLSRTLRPRIRKAFDHAQMIRIHQRLATSGVPKRQMERILKGASRRTANIVRANHVMQDGMITVPMIKPEGDWLKQADADARSMDTGRRIYLRRELRAGNLALAFLRGMSVDTIEAKANEPIPFDKIERIIKEYGDGGPNQYDNAFSAWRVDALAHGTHPQESKSVKRREQRDAKEAKAGYSRLMWGEQRPS